MLWSSVWGSESYIVMFGYRQRTARCGRLRLKHDGTRAETTFRLSPKRTSPFKSAGSVSSVDCWQQRCANQRQ